MNRVSVPSRGLGFSSFEPLHRFMNLTSGSFRPLAGFRF